MRRFQQEARDASALNHPNILTIHEIGSENSTYFIATEKMAISAETSWSIPDSVAAVIVSSPANNQTTSKHQPEKLNFRTAPEAAENKVRFQ